MLGEQNTNHGMGLMSHLLRSQRSGLKTFQKSWCRFTWYTAIWWDGGV